MEMKDAFKEALSDDDIKLLFLQKEKELKGDLQIVIEESSEHKLDAAPDKDQAEPDMINKVAPPAPTKINNIDDYKAIV